MAHDGGELPFKWRTHGHCLSIVFIYQLRFQITIFFKSAVSWEKELGRNTKSDQFELFKKPGLKNAHLKCAKYYTNMRYQDFVHCKLCTNKILF